MDRQIPIYFDSVVVESPIEQISASNPNLGRLKVRVFTKYGNRNGSYITDAVAEQLIQSIYKRPTPVVGFFDPETQEWASHTGPLLANSYGYVRDFIGWETYTDTDGVAREYAVFTVDMFIGYYEEAQKVLGQNQSMELDPQSITGDWALIGDTEYYVYKTAEMLGFCIIGNHEPCFSVSAFFSKQDNEYQSQFDKFSSLLTDLKAQVEEAERINQGGEQQMDEFTVENPQVQEEVVETPIVEEFQAEEEVKTSESTPNEFDVLQQQFNELQARYDALVSDNATVQEHMTELETNYNAAIADLEHLRAENAQFQATIQEYANQALAAENERKNVLVNKYTNLLTEEEITSIRETVNDFSYDELESKLAVIYANKMFAQTETPKVFIPEQPKDQFALFMEKYHK